jgi:hypothetical protein
MLRGDERPSHTQVNLKAARPYFPARPGPARPHHWALPCAAARRNAPAEVLQQAVHSSLLFSHTHELGRDGALVQAAAAAFLSK